MNYQSYSYYFSKIPTGYKQDDILSTGILTSMILEKEIEILKIWLNGPTGDPNKPFIRKQSSAYGGWGPYPPYHHQGVALDDTKHPLYLAVSNDFYEGFVAIASDPRVNVNWPRIITHTVMCKAYNFFEYALTKLPNGQSLQPELIKHILTCLNPDLLKIMLKSGKVKKSKIGLEVGWIAPCFSNHLDTDGGAISEEVRWEVIELSFAIAPETFLIHVPISARDTFSYITKTVNCNLLDYLRCNKHDSDAMLAKCEHLLYEFFNDRDACQARLMNDLARRGIIVKFRDE